MRVHERNDAAAGLSDRPFDTFEFGLVYPELAESAEILDAVEVESVRAGDCEAADLGAACGGAGSPEAVR